MAPERVEWLKQGGQRSRLAVGLAYVGFLAIVDVVVFGHLVPPLDPSGAWFYSGLLLILLGTSLVEPYFTRPAAAVTNATVALVVVPGYLQIASW